MPISFTSLTHFSPDTDLSVFLYSCKQTGAKIRAHILAPACLCPGEYYTVLKKIAQNQPVQVRADSADIFFMAKERIPFLSMHYQLKKRSKSFIFYLSVRSLVPFIELSLRQLKWTRIVTTWAKCLRNKKAFGIPLLIVCSTLNTFLKYYIVQSY